jgi:hypothetical protein
MSDPNSVAIVGGGAAGLMAAISAARLLPSGSVCLLEAQERVGRKILATGNGRCNLSHQTLSPDSYHGGDPAWIAAVLSGLGAEATQAWFRRLGLICRTDPDGRIFPFSYQAAAVLDLLRRACACLGVREQTGCRIVRLQPGVATGFDLTDSLGSTLHAQTVVLATGGLAAPALGGDAGGYALLTAWGHRLIEPFPAIVQICTETQQVRGLSGIKFDGRATLVDRGRCLARRFGEILLTDYGLSGPPILQLARLVGEQRVRAPGAVLAVHLDILPEWSLADLTDWLAERQDLDPLLPLNVLLLGLVHKKVGQALVRLATGRAPDEPIGRLAAADRQKIAALLKDWPIRVLGTRDWSQAQVTAGGLDTADFRPETLESRLMSGVFAAGEMLDVDGDCGGFNLQWAWSSGYRAGTSAARRAAAGKPL